MVVRHADDGAHFFRIIEELEGWVEVPDIHEYRAFDSDVLDYLRHMNVSLPDEDALDVRALVERRRQCDDEETSVDSLSVCARRI